MLNTPSKHMPVDQAHTELANLMRADFVELVLSILIAAAGIAALAIHFLRTRNRSRELLWFGLGALAYGIRLLIKTPAFEVLFDAPPRFFRFVEIGLSDVILIPFLLFIERMHGKGWRNGMRWLVWFFAAYGAYAIAHDVWKGTPATVIDPGAFFLMLFPLFLLISYLGGYRPPPMAHWKPLAAAFTIFFFSILNEHLVEMRVVPWRLRVEHLGFFVLICAMGYVALRQVFDREQDLLMLEEEMRSATRIQSSILPREVPHIEGAAIAVRYLPMTAVAGDFYEFVQTGPRQLGIAIADVAGHGVPAALVASMVKVAIDSQSAVANHPPLLMAGINDIMCRQARGKLITAGYLFLDLQTRRAIYSAGAHPPLLLRRADGRLQEMKENGLILGVRAGETYDAMAFELCPGDRILLYTDGIAEAANASDQLFSELRLSEIASRTDQRDATAFAAYLLDEVHAWAGPAQADDMTLIVIDING